MKYSLLKAWAYGVGILFIVNTAWLIALQIDLFSGVLLVLLQVSPFFASFFSAYLAPRKKIILGISMAVPAAILAFLINFTVQIFGNSVDFPGIRGGLIFFIITIVYSGILCLIGACVGYALSRKMEELRKSGWDTKPDKTIMYEDRR